MGEMHEMYGAHKSGESNPLEGDEDAAGPYCFNCQNPIEGGRPRLFCSELCQQEAALVRYVRRCRADGRIEQPDVLEALEVRFAMVLGGGYPERARTVPDAIRRQVAERDGGLCANCGEPGDEVDHIDGSSNDLENLRLLCHDCHMQRTQDSLEIIGPDHPLYEAVAEQRRRLDARIEATNPLVACDDPDEWTRSYRTIHARATRELEPEPETVGLISMAHGDVPMSACLPCRLRRPAGQWWRNGLGRPK